jgi:hypothetical protein
MSNFPVQDGKGNTKPVPVMYGDLTRQVASIIRENSENKLPSAPRMSVYITGLEQDRSRTSDSTFVSKLNIRERHFNKLTGEYDNYQGRNYTVERLMPTPYTLTANVDIWASSTDQKLQILEQILVWFNPSLEIQTTDNFVDWTSLSVVNLENIIWSNRSIPVGVDSEIDVATLTFSMPIYINAPAKVKRMGVITNIITSLFNEATGTIESGVLACNTSIYDDSYVAGPVPNPGSGPVTNPGPGSITNPDSVPVTNPGPGPVTNPGPGEGIDVDNGTRIQPIVPGQSVINTTVQTFSVNYDEYALYIKGNKGTIINNRGRVGNVNWYSVTDALPGEYKVGISRIYISNRDDGNFSAGTFGINPLDEREIIIDWDDDSFPDDTPIEGPAGTRTTIDYIINPIQWNPTPFKTSGLRILLLHDIGAEINIDGADGWKSTNGEDFIAQENDIVEWDGNRWHVVFDASVAEDTIYVTNLRTGVQYKFEDGEWINAIDGEYPIGTWGMNLDG